MTEKELHAYLQLHYPRENERCEWKAFSNLTHELKAHYIKQRGLDDEHYKNLIVEYLKKFGESPRKNIEKFLRDKLPDILTESQKKNKITNLLSALRIKGTIRNNGYSKWSPV